eukprot:m.37938 g.37938  ORF g.37938 m.37938 type:complete len:512 (-) comp17792_c0_seq1:1769-3304(-)
MSKHRGSNSWTAKRGKKGFQKRGMVCKCSGRRCDGNTKLVNEMRRVVPPYSTREQFKLKLSNKEYVHDNALYWCSNCRAFEESLWPTKITVPEHDSTRGNQVLLRSRYDADLLHVRSIERMPKEMVTIRRKPKRKRVSQSMPVVPELGLNTDLNTDPSNDCDNGNLSDTEMNNGEPIDEASLRTTSSDGAQSHSLTSEGERMVCSIKSRLGIDVRPFDVSNSLADIITARMPVGMRAMNDDDSLDAFDSPWDIALDGCDEPWFDVLATHKLWFESIAKPNVECTPETLARELLHKHITTSRVTNEPLKDDDPLFAEILIAIGAIEFTKLAGYRFGSGCTEGVKETDSQEAQAPELPFIEEKVVKWSYSTTVAEEGTGNDSTMHQASWLSLKSLVAHIPCAKCNTTMQPVYRSEGVSRTVKIRIGCTTCNYNFDWASDEFDTPQSTADTQPMVVRSPLEAREYFQLMLWRGQFEHLKLQGVASGLPPEMFASRMQFDEFLERYLPIVEERRK